MKTLFKSQDYWNLVESGYDAKDNDEGWLKENKKKDSKAFHSTSNA